MNYVSFMINRSEKLKIESKFVGDTYSLVNIKTDSVNLSLEFTIEQYKELRNSIDNMISEMNKIEKK